MSKRVADEQTSYCGPKRLKLAKRDHTEQTRDFFDAAAGGWTARYDRDASIAARKARFLAAVQARLPAPANILDFGCGSGDITLDLSQAGYRMTGFDLSEAMLAAAHRADTEGSVQWVARADSAPGASFPFQDAAFDAVVASSVLEYVPDLEATLAQFARILRPGGWLYATVPDMRDPIRKREAWLRLVASIPGIGALLNRSRWREGGAYLRISNNRMRPELWREHLHSVGFAPEALSVTIEPLLLLTARKR